LPEKLSEKAGKLIEYYRPEFVSTCYDFAMIKFRESDVTLLSVTVDVERLPSRSIGPLKFPEASIFLLYPLWLAGIPLTDVIQNQSVMV